MGKEDSKAPPPSTPPKSKWRRLLWVAIPAIALLSGILLFLSSNMGMQRVVLPLVASRYNLDLVANHASLNLTGNFHAKDVIIKVLDDNGSVTVYAKLPKVTIELFRKGGPHLSAKELDLEIIRWPQKNQPEPDSPSVGEGSFFLDSYSIAIDQSNIAVPPISFLDGRSPRLTLNQSTLNCVDGMHSLDSIGDANFSECPPSWHWLNQTEVSLNATSSVTANGQLWTGALHLDNRFSTAPVPELESVTLKNSFKLYPNGVGTMDIVLLGKEHSLATIHSTVQSKGQGKVVSVILSGPALNIPTNFLDTYMKLDAWKSRFTVDWQSGTIPFKSDGRISIPGVTFSLPGAPSTYLPPLALNGLWEAVNPEKGSPRWNVSADLLKGDKPLVQIISSSTGTTPVEIKMPPCRLEELNSYAQPFNLSLPRGEIQGGLNLNIDDSGLYRGLLTVNVSQLEVGRGKDQEYLKASATIEGELRPKESMALKRTEIKGLLSSKDGVERGKFTVDLLKGSTIFFDARDRLDSPGKLILGLTAIVHDTSKESQGDLSVKCRTGLNLTERPQLWFELLGNIRGRTFLQGTVNATLRPDWSLRYLEVSNANISNLSGSHTELFSNLFGVELNSLSANAVIRESPSPEGGHYGFSSSLRYSGLKGLSWLPPSLSASQDLKVIGSIDIPERMLSIADVALNTQLTSDEIRDKKINVFLASKNLRLLWSPRFIIEQGTVDTKATIPAVFLPNARPNSELPDLSLSARLSATTQQDGHHLSAIAFSSNLGKQPVLSFNVFGNFLEAGSLESLELNQLTFSLPKQLAASLSPLCPTVKAAHCNGQFKDNAFTLDASVSGISNIPQMPKDLILSSSLAIKGTSLGQQILFSTLGLKCNAENSDKSDYFGAQADLTNDGTIRMNGAWNPTSISIPLSIKGGAAPLFLNKLSMFNTLTNERLKLNTGVRIEGMPGSYTTYIDGTAAIGEKPIIDLSTRLSQNKTFQVVSLKTKKCVINNQGLSPDFLALPKNLQWDRVSLAGNVNRAVKGDQFDLEISCIGLNTPDTRSIRPFNVRIDTTGQWTSSSKQMSLTSFKLLGNSLTRSKVGQMQFQLETNDSLHFKLTEPVPLLMRKSSGSVIAKGSISPEWLAETTGLPPVKNGEPLDWQGSLQLIPGKDGNRSVFSINARDKTSQPVIIKGDINQNLNGIPISGNVTGTLVWSPIFGLITERLRFSQWDQADVTMAVTESSKAGSTIETQWKVDGIQSFLHLPKNDTLEATGSIKARISSDGKVLKLSNAVNTLKNTQGSSVLTATMETPWSLKPVWKETTFSISSHLQEAFLLKMAGRSASATQEALAIGGKLVVTPDGGELKLTYTGDIKQAKQQVLDIATQINLGPAFAFQQLRVNRLVINRSKTLGRLIPALNPYECERSEFTGKLTQKNSSFFLTADMTLSAWKHRSWTQATVSKATATIAAHGKKGEAFKLTDFTFNSELNSPQGNEYLGSLAWELSAPGKLSISNLNYELSGRLNYSGIVKTIPGVDIKLPESAINGMVAVGIAKDSLTLDGTAVLNDKDGEVVKLQARSEGNLKFKLQQLALKNVDIAYRPWLSDLMNLSGVKWAETRGRLDWSRAATTGELKGPYTFIVKGLSSDAYPLMTSSFKLKGITAMKLGTRPTLTGTDLVWNGASKKGVNLFSLNFTHTGDPFRLPADWSTFAPGNIAIAGTLTPELIHLLGNQSTTATKRLDRPLHVNGQLIIDSQKLNSELRLMYEKREVMKLISEYNAKDKFGGLTLSVPEVPDDIVNSLFSPTYLPEFRNAELKITARPGKSDSWMVYTTAKIEKFTDRLGRTRTGDLKLDSHCEFIPVMDGQWKASSFPIQLSWDKTILFSCTADVSTGQSSSLNLRFMNGQTSLTNLFAALAPNTLSPGLICTKGTLMSSGSFTVKDDSWVANSRHLVNDAFFEPVPESNRRSVAFDWDIVINTKGQMGKSSTLKVTSKGPGWANNASLEASWIASQRAPTSLRVVSEGADFTPIWDVFRPNTPFPPPSQAPINIYRLLPDDATLRSFSGDYQVDLNDVEIGPIQVDKTQIRLVGSNGRLAIVKWTSEINSGIVTATGHLQSSELGSTVMLDVTGKDIPLKPILSAVYDGADSDSLRGKLDFNSQIEGKGTSLVDAVNMATGKGSLSIDDFRFYKDEALIPAAEKASIDDLEYLAFDSISSNLVFADGRMRTSKFKMERDELIQTMTITIAGAGRIKISDIEPRITVSHYSKYFSGKISQLVGFGPGKDAPSGYKAFKFPVNLVRDASGWSVEVLDKGLYTPFKQSAVGSWILPILNEKKKD